MEQAVLKRIDSKAVIEVEGKVTLYWGLARFALLGRLNLKSKKNLSCVDMGAS